MSPAAEEIPHTISEGVPIEAGVHADGDPLQMLIARKIVSFSLGGRSYGISAEHVSEVAQPLPLTPLPRGPANLLGIACLRGEIIAVLNLVRALGGGLTPAPASPKLLVLNGRGGNIRMALPVESVREIAQRGGSEFSEQCGLRPLLDPDTLERALAAE
jgi:chemotaxis signal transduction protein